MDKQAKCDFVVNFERCYKGAVLCDKEISIKQDQTHETEEFFVRVKEFLKRFPNLYIFLIRLVSPIYYSNREERKLIKKHLTKNSIIINVASGNRVVHEDIINIDLFSYSKVDIVSDATNLCLKSGSIDLILNTWSLEHIYEYKKEVEEAYRVLKKGGEAYFTAPFIYAFHASPYDYHRFTFEGFRRLFTECGFKVKKIGVLGGAASGLTGVLTEFLSILFSFGSIRLHNALFLIFTLLLFPIKFLDFFLNKMRFSKKIAAGFYIIVER